MEKGSFHPSGQVTAGPVHAKTVDEKVKNIPIPSQIPKGIDFDEISPKALKSSTIENLISQNEDLMARLSVALRRVSQMEDQLVTFEEERKTYRARFETVKEQLLILQQKDQAATGRSVRLYEENQEVSRRAEKLEDLYTDLYNEAKALKTRLVRLERYRARIRKAAPGVQNGAKKASRFESELIILKKELAVQHSQLVANYEARLAEARRELLEAQKEFQETKIKAQERDKLYQETIDLQNQMVAERRQHEQNQGDLETTLGNLQQEVTSLRAQVKELLVEREDQQQTIGRLQHDLPHLTERNHNLIEQVESLQALWNHKQKELERSEAKNQGLQKLNQTMSVTLNQQRKEVVEIRAQMEQEKFTSAERIKTLELEIAMLKNSKNSE